MRIPNLLVVVLLLGLCDPALAVDQDRLAGDVLQFGPPVVALSIAFFRDDTEGEKEWLRNTAASAAAVQLTKLIFDQTALGRRPGGGTGSFPSGHTAMAASGAAFLTERYGWEYGLPAWAVTGFVAYTRVDEGKHNWWDCVAGAALSYGISELFVTPQTATHLAPVVGPDFIGLRWQRSF
jgi:membrane-associated phospholipid phosphatase